MQQYHRLNEEFEDLGGYTFRGEITAVIRGLGFTDEEFDKPVHQLSGGQKNRMYWCWMNLQTIWILRPLNGWRAF